MTTLDKLSAIEARCNAATEGPWNSSREDLDSFTTNPENGEIDSVAYVYRDPEDRIGVFGQHFREDSRFIAAARTDLPKLVAFARLAYLKIRDRGCTCMTIKEDGIDIRCHRCQTLAQLDSML